MFNDHAKEGSVTRSFKLSIRSEILKKKSWQGWLIILQLGGSE